jgi:hypothetical protein
MSCVPSSSSSARAPPQRARRAHRRGPPPDGMIVRVASAKTNQVGAGKSLCWHTQPVRARARCARSAPGSTRPRSPTGRSSGVLAAPGAVSSPLSRVGRPDRQAPRHRRGPRSEDVRRPFAALGVRDPRRARRLSLSAEIADVTRHRDRRVLDGYIRAGRGVEHVARVVVRGHGGPGRMPPRPRRRRRRRLTVLLLHEGAPTPSGTPAASTGVVTRTRRRSRSR